jgi:2-methylcitrate dehydratase
MEEHRLDHEDIAAVDVGTSQRAMRVLAFSDPATPYQAKYSMPHCIAAAMVDRRVSLETFTGGKLQDREILAARTKISLSFPDLPIWPGLADVGPETEFVGNPVTIRTADGRTHSARVDIPRGDPALPLSDEELVTKYRECAGAVLGPGDAEQSMKLLLGLEAVENIRRLMAVAGSRSRPG